MFMNANTRSKSHIKTLRATCKSTSSTCSSGTNTKHGGCEICANSVLREYNQGDAQGLKLYIQEDKEIAKE